MPQPEQPSSPTASQPRLSLKQQLGCWWHERWLAEAVLRWPKLARWLGWHWRDLKNRHEQLSTIQPDARVCKFRYSSWLTLSRVFPRVGYRLYRRWQREQPIIIKPNAASQSTNTLPTQKAQATQAVQANNQTDQPQASSDISVILPVGGTDRLAQATAVLHNFTQQQLAPREIILVEQLSPGSTANYAHLTELSAVLQQNIRHLRVEDDGAFNKSRVMNMAARAATGNIFLFHDADVLVPTHYCQLIQKRLGSSLSQQGHYQGWQITKPIRFCIHASESDTKAITTTNDLGQLTDASQIQQNNPGLSTAITRNAYWKIGGHDESFVGWGGEDVEFLDRAQSLDAYPGGSCVTVHLWHPSAEQKSSGDRNQYLQDYKLAIPRTERIAQLVALHNNKRDQQQPNQNH